jgi:divinyl protochlorophyllide a 8-vinyl-reductase
MDASFAGGYEQSARIGPNAILQLIPVLDAALGIPPRQALFDRAGVALPPPDAGMLPERQVIRLHAALWHSHPDLAPGLLRKAGLATGDYILANRIPRLAQAVIRNLPKRLAARVLAMAIAKHAWTFAGSGKFAVESLAPLTFTLRDNPLASGTGEYPDCHWHSAVFERLFSALVWPALSVTETDCAARGGNLCRFVIEPQTSA